MLPPLILYHDFILFLLFLFLFYCFIIIITIFFNHDFIALASQPPLITPTPALDITL